MKWPIQAWVWSLHAATMGLQSSYLVSQQSRNTCFRGVTNGREVVAPLQGQNYPATSQAHQLLRQVPETCNGKREIQVEGRAGAGRARGRRWQQIKASRSALHHITDPGGWHTAAHNGSQVRSQ